MKEHDFKKKICSPQTKSKVGVAANNDETQDNKTVNIPFSDEDAAEKTVENTFQFETAKMNPDCYEKLGPEIEEREKANDLLKVMGLEKIYENGFKAVNGINVKMYTDQIFVLLGHNGAGKTTTISMLTGLVNSTFGDANLFGIDMFS